ncbi:gamma-glutamyl-gamma-aminobutyrate hydrolase family protein [Actinomyces bowdenii]|uniref:anthranilate synthase component II n=1 Tax=Actinomyces bowdenii TaxID=131109 RepID=UPI001ABC9D3F|nr:gamma-glutamyl-gamma-aminobutyrate hydrolase family protein [Actinomyces bowdenii]MBO3723974.1 gamma-glutamyl-gamma-aminobutyrate hydrolase family protein [Actinomyces bowdenii]
MARAAATAGGTGGSGGAGAKPGGPARVVLLDNRDSFVYNLVDQFASLGADIEVYRNHVSAERVLAALEPTAAELAAGKRPVLCLSPGPGHPRTSGCLMELVEAGLGRAIPMLGICLGFQAMVEACGGTIAPVGPVHGRSDRVKVTAQGRADAALAVLDGAPLDVARYHSLGTRALPEDLICLARTTGGTGEGGAGIVMAARHRSAPAVGLQFHPESILTPQGPALLRALTADLAAARAARPGGPPPHSPAPSPRTTKETAR